MDSPIKTYLSEHDCAYIEGNQAGTLFFFAPTVFNGTILDELLSRGWRKFGNYYFQPHCTGCQECVPLRIDVNQFKASKSQRRVLKKNLDVTVEFRPLEYRDEVYEIYLEHTNRFPQKPSGKEEFFKTFYELSCPAFQSEYYIDGKLVAVGFLDHSSRALSSVYFVYRTEFTSRKLGTFSILKEVEQCQKLELNYYYLGYYIAENQRMAYKARFHPHQLMDWDSGRWLNEIN